ncbi:hypothetical protein [Methanolapillus ohkumae]
MKSGKNTGKILMDDKKRLRQKTNRQNERKTKNKKQPKNIKNSNEII